MPDAQLTEFGAHLRRAREARGVTLRRIADVTKISVRALEAVERNDFSRLPGGIFTRSFVRAYAVEAGLDPDETVRQFLAQCPNKDLAAVPVNSPECIDGPRRSSWLTRLGGVRVLVPVLAALLLAIVAVIGLRWALGAGSSEADSSVLPTVPSAIIQVVSPAPPVSA
jgi:cytoskeleton protein RodZ